MPYGLPGLSRASLPFLHQGVWAIEKGWRTGFEPAASGATFRRSAS